MWTCPLSLSVLAYLTFKPQRDKASVWTAGGCCLLWRIVVQLPLLSVSVDGIHLQKRAESHGLTWTIPRKMFTPRPEGCICPSLESEFSWTNIAQCCILLCFLWPVVPNKSSLTPFFLSPWGPVSQILLNLSPKHFQICSLLSLPASTAIVRATATFAKTIAVSSLLPIS